jgi:hypothetical protein
MSLKSKTTVARIGSTSLRATVPEGIVAFLELNEGDVLEWKMEFENGERIVRVSKAHAINQETMKLASKYAKAKVKK